MACTNWSPRKICLVAGQMRKLEKFLPYWPELFNSSQVRSKYAPCLDVVVGGGCQWVLSTFIRCLFGGGGGGGNGGGCYVVQLKDIG